MTELHYPRMDKFKVFGRDAVTGGNLMALVTEPHNPAESGIPVTVLLEASNCADIRFRFFYPGSKEAPICGHALLGAAQRVSGDHFRVETGSGICEVRKQGDYALVNFGPQQRLEPGFTGQPDPAWFGLGEGDMAVTGVFSAGKPKLCIKVRSAEALRQVRFDLTPLGDWNRNKNFSGYMLWCRDNNLIYARASNPLYNMPEDAACAICCAALPLSEGKSVQVAMGWPEFENRIRVENHSGDIWVGGKVFAL
ncbi:PhzF family phenazine biosynthesis protein [Marinobacterium jannaschii]|uniref:PhzF family phenazine biosynthesis protein n=1 Tax=Marinobacterium jannaschii TaxID=64970 RepID=UPI001B80DDDD|nr:PhzF family phenazine biosynthesis protein [Marinobacterium jannaschii]